MNSSEQRRILLVDDDHVVRETMLFYLEDCGYAVEQTDNVDSAFACFQQGSFDLVLTDLRMPEKSGLVLLDQIKKVDADMPVVVYSGAGMMGDVVRALRYGASDYLLKPFSDMEIVGHSIEKAIEQCNLRRQNQRYFVDLEKANSQLKQYIAKLEEDQIAGGEVQKQLLPYSPIHCNDYTVAHKLFPRLYLSGDFLDVTVVLGRFLLFYLVDVSGHGASSAFATVWLKNAVSQLLLNRSYLKTLTGPKPDTNVFLHDINRRLVTSQLQHHMTCFHGMLDMNTHKLRYSVAGHLPLPIMISKGSSQFLSGKGKPIGLFADEEWPLYEVDMPENSQILVFSDGLLEVIPEQGLIDKEAYLQEQMAAKSEGLEKPLGIEPVVDWIQGLTSENPDDDIAVLSVCRES